MFGLGTAKSIVGLDIGSSSIKAVELKKTKGEISVSSLGVDFRILSQISNVETIASGKAIRELRRLRQ